MTAARVCTITLNPAIDLTAGIDGFREGQVNRVVWAQEDAGGKGVNVASFLAARGIAVTACGLMGADNAQSFETHVAAAAIAARFVPVPGRTRTNVKLVDTAKPAGEGVTDVNFPGFVASADDLATLDATLAELARDHAWFALAGSLPAGLADDTYARLVRRLKAAGCRVVLDTSGAALTAALAAAPDVVKPNIHELADAIGHVPEGRAAILAAAQALHGRGIGVVIVSMGPEGAIFSTGAEAVHAVPGAVAVRSTVGAGDAMVAGFIAASLEGRPLAEAARLATAFSMGVLEVIGPRLPAADVIAAHERAVRVERLRR